MMNAFARPLINGAQPPSWGNGINPVRPVGPVNVGAFGNMPMPPVMPPQSMMPFHNPMALPTNGAGMEARPVMPPVRYPAMGVNAFSGR